MVSLSLSLNPTHASNMKNQNDSSVEGWPQPMILGANLD